MSWRTQGWQGSNWIRRNLRVAIYERDGWRCVWCSATSPLCLDHVRTCAGSGWDNRPANLVTARQGCNNRRRDMSVRAWLRLLEGDMCDPIVVVRRLRRARRTPVDRVAARAILGGARDIEVRRAADYTAGAGA